MFRKHLAIAAVMSALPIPSLASAGTDFVSNPSIHKHSSGLSQFSGALSPANTPSDRVQYVGCRSNRSGGVCFAMNSNQEYLSCSTRDPALNDAIRSMPASTHITVVVDAEGECASIDVSGRAYSFVD